MAAPSGWRGGMRGAWARCWPRLDPWRGRPDPGSVSPQGAIGAGSGSTAATYDVISGRTSTGGPSSGAAELGRGAALSADEEAGEVRGVIEPEGEPDLLHRHGRVHQAALSFGYQPVVDQAHGGTAGRRPASPRQMLDAHAELACVLAHRPALCRAPVGQGLEVRHQQPGSAPSPPAAVGWTEPARQRPPGSGRGTAAVARARPGPLPGQVLMQEFERRSQQWAWSCKLPLIG